MVNQERVTPFPQYKHIQMTDQTLDSNVKLKH